MYTSFLSIHNYFKFFDIQTGYKIHLGIGLQMVMQNKRCYLLCVMIIKYGELFINVFLANGI